MSRSPGALEDLLRSLRPRRNPGVYGFARLSEGTDPRGLAPIATFRESEGLTVVAEVARLERRGLTVEFRAAWITLQVRSELHAIGLTAAVAAALADEGIPCNVMAGLCHDHLFVPTEMAVRACQALRGLQRAARRRAPER